VSEWVWARGVSDRWWLEPQYTARRGLEPGKDYAAPPRRRRGAGEYGYDERGRLLLARRYVDDVDFQLQVVEYFDGVALARSYFSDVTGRLEHVVRYVLDDDRRVLLAEHAAPDPSWLYWLEEFDYDASGRLQAVKFERTDFTTMPTAPDIARGVQRLSHHGDELVAVAEEYVSGYPGRTVYSRVAGNAQEISRIALSGVVRAIRTAITEGLQDEPICMLALSYVPGGMPLPPVCHRLPELTLARTLRERRSLLRVQSRRVAHPGSCARARRTHCICVRHTGAAGSAA
jgi:hypothetical protein